MKEKLSTLQEKAKILANGGIVEISGMRVILGHKYSMFEPCYHCDMDYICHFGNDVFILCKECDKVTGEDCFLIPFE